jgi:hypothetical protein
LPVPSGTWFTLFGLLHVGLDVRSPSRLSAALCLRRVGIEGRGSVGVRLPRLEQFVFALRRGPCG